MPQVIVLPDARQEIRAQAHYYEDRGSPETADRWLERVEATFDGLAEGRLFGEARRPLRRRGAVIYVAPVLDFPNQVVLYEKVPGGIVVLHVRGAREDLRRFLGPAP